MKNIIKKLNIFVVIAVLFLPTVVSADSWDYSSGYDDWDYNYSTGYDDWDYNYSTGYDDWDYNYSTGNSYDYGTSNYQTTYDYGYDNYDYDYNYDYGASYDYGLGCNGGCNGGGRTIVEREVVVVNNNNNLDVVCRVSDRTIEDGDDVTFTAEVSGGRGSISYDWSGDIDSNSRSVVRQFNNSGTYDVDITVRDSRGNTATDECTVVVENDNRNNDFDIACRISDTRIDEGDRVRIEVDIDGGNSPFDIEWDGDIDEVDDFDENDRSQYIRFDDRGRYDFEVTVRDDDGNRRTDDCSTIVVDDNDGTFVSNTRVFDYPTGNYSSVESVFLNQVPYTGPAETFKLIGFIGLVLAWSFAGAFMIRKKMNKVVASKRISEFKEANKVTQNI